MLMGARDEETGETMTDLQLRDEVITMFGAGHETTANAMTWTFYLLSKNPTVERRVHEEVDRVLNGRTPELSDLEKLPLVRNTVKESMRVLPPVWVIGRHAIADDEISGYHIPAGSFVLVSAYATHRHPKFWDNPEGFDPDRFTTERARELPRFAYYPFGGGPHLCIGNNFATMEAELLLATILSKFRLDLVPGHKVELEPTITLRSRHGMQMTLRDRSTPAMSPEPPAGSAS
jgi:cytochrome P450